MPVTLWRSIQLVAGMLTRPKHDVKLLMSNYIALHHVLSTEISHPAATLQHG